MNPAWTKLICIGWRSVKAQGDYQFFREHEADKVIIGTGHRKAILLAKALEKNGFKTNINYSKSLLAKDKSSSKRSLQN